MQTNINNIQAAFQQAADAAPPVVNEKHTYSYAELYKDKDQEQKFIIPDLLPSCAVAVLLGEDGIGKTQIAVQLALTIALNLPTFMTLPVSVTSARALVVATEEARQKFIKAATKQQHVMKPDIRPEDVHLDFTEGADFDNYEELIEEIRAHLLQHSYSLIIIDALSDLFTLVDGEINSNTHARVILQALQSLCAKYLTTILIIHHAAKTKIEAKLKDGKLFVTKNDSQGAGAITQKPRTILALTHDPRTITNNGQSYHNFLHVVKANLMSKFYVNNILELEFDANTLLHHFRSITDRETYEKNGPNNEIQDVSAKPSTPINMLTGNALKDRQLHEQRCKAAFQAKPVLTRQELVARLQSVYQVGSNKVSERNGLINQLLDMGLMLKEGRNYRIASSAPLEPPVNAADFDWGDGLPTANTNNNANNTGSPNTDDLPF